MSHYVFGSQPRYIVTAAAVVAVLTNGQQTHIYRGKPLPLNTRRSQVEHLLATGMIKETEHDHA
jgi:hypothetical protein